MRLSPAACPVTWREPTNNVDNYNDYQAHPYEPGPKPTTGAMSKILGTYEGDDMVRDYSDIYASYS